MVKRLSILIALVALVGGSGYVLSSRWHLKDAVGSSMSTKSASVEDAHKLEPIVIPEGTVIETRLLDTLSTRTNRVGDHFSATVEHSVMVDGKEIIPVGAIAVGVVTSVKESGRLKGRSYISMRLQSIETKDGNRMELATNAVSRLGASNRDRNWALLGGGAAVGAGIGALAGGGKGVAIGGPVGFGAGLATKSLIRGHEVTIPSETLLRFRLTESVPVKTS